MKAFDFAFVSANGDSKMAYFIFLIKAGYGFVVQILSASLRISGYRTVQCK
jgi:hypothetical protein